jgi:RNA polymerase Rpb2, domain 6
MYFLYCVGYVQGTNAVVAVISYTGFDMEDAMILNKSSYERGFGHARYYHYTISCSYFFMCKRTVRPCHFVYKYSHAQSYQVRSVVILWYAAQHEYSV